MRTFLLTFLCSLCAFLSGCSSYPVIRVSNKTTDEISVLIQGPSTATAPISYYPPRVRRCSTTVPPMEATRVSLGSGDPIEAWNSPLVFAAQIASDRWHVFIFDHYPRRRQVSLLMLVDADGDLDVRWEGADVKSRSMSCGSVFEVIQEMDRMSGVSP